VYFQENTSKYLKVLLGLCLDLDKITRYIEFRRPWSWLDDIFIRRPGLLWNNTILVPDFSLVLSDLPVFSVLNIKSWHAGIDNRQQDTDGH